MNKIERRFVYGFCVVAFMTLCFLCFILGIAAFGLIHGVEVPASPDSGVIFNYYGADACEAMANTDMLPDANEETK
jgi:hypothetical protein